MTRLPGTGSTSTWAARLVREPAFLAAAIMTIGMSALALAYPHLDLDVSGKFYTPGQGFPATLDTLPLITRSLGRIMPGIAIAAVAVLAIIRLISRKPLASAKDRTLLFLGLCFSVAPGLIVNVLFKGYLGRPRPIASQDFGGPLPFTPPWSWWGGCPANCSFVSGEASTAMMLMALVFVAPACYRMAILIAVLIWTFIISLNRVAFGAHYLSDVVIACGLTLACIAIFKVLVLDRPETPPLA